MPYLTPQERAEMDSLLSKGNNLWPGLYGIDCVASLESFLLDCCWTWDDETKTIERIPDSPYVRLIAQRWYRSRRLGTALVIEKSRRLLASWILSGCELWAQGLQMETAVICGLDYPKASAHVWRIAWLYRQARKRLWPELEDCVCRGGNYDAHEVEQVILPNGSIWDSLNQEGQSFQGEGYSRVRLEEISRYRRPGAMWAQAKIVTGGRAGVITGHRVAVTNASPQIEWKGDRKNSGIKSIKRIKWNKCPRRGNWPPSLEQLSASLAEAGSTSGYITPQTQESGTATG